MPSWSLQKVSCGPCSAPEKCSGGFYTSTGALLQRSPWCSSCGHPQCFFRAHWCPAYEHQCGFPTGILCFSNSAAGRSRHPCRNDHHRLAAPLQPPLNGEGGLVVQKPLVPAFTPEDYLARKEGCLGEFAVQPAAELFRFIHRICAQLVVALARNAPPPRQQLLKAVGLIEAHEERGKP